MLRNVQETHESKWVYFLIHLLETEPCWDNLSLKKRDFYLPRMKDFLFSELASLFCKHLCRSILRAKLREIWSRRSNWEGIAPGLNWWQGGPRLS